MLNVRMNEEKEYVLRKLQRWQDINSLPTTIATSSGYANIESAADATSSSLRKRGQQFEMSMVSGSAADTSLAQDENDARRARRKHRAEQLMQSVSWWDRWKLMGKKGRMRRANYAAAAIMISQQLCGINLLAFLADTFFRNSIFKDPTAPDAGDNYKLLGLSIGFGAVNFLATLIVVPFIIDRNGGRRLLLNISFPIMAFCLLISGLVLKAPKKVHRFDDGSQREVSSSAVLGVHYTFLVLFTAVRTALRIVSKADGTLGLLHRRGADCFCDSVRSFLLCQP